MNANADAKESKVAERAESHWWETYLIRYPIPSLVGALALLVVLLALPGSRESVLELVRGEGDKTGFDKTGILLLGGALAVGGVVLSYLASTPMLVLHAMRPFIRARKRNSLSTALPLLALLVAMWVGVVVIIGPVFFATLVGGVRWIVMSLFLIVIACQVFLLARFMWNLQSRALFDYYTTLSQKREARNHVEFLTSMRHLREHGNAVSIVCLEFLVSATGYFMFSNESMSTSEQVLAASALLGSWTLPAAVVWYVAQQLEAELEGDATPP